MSSRADDVRAFFDTPERYLRHDFGIRLRCEIVRELLDKVDKARILDAGCGDGSISLQFLAPGISLTLLDLSDEMLAIARKHTPPALAANVRFVRSDLMAFASPAPFDVVLCLGLMAHVDSADLAIAHLASLLKPGGYCVLQITDQATLIARIESSIYALRRSIVDERRYAMNYFRAVEFLERVGQHGLKRVAERRYSLLLPGMGRLPRTWLYRYQRQTLDRPWLSRHGSELVLLLRKSAS